MFGESHDIPHEFPEYQDLIQKLCQSDAEFQRIYGEYHELDKEIHDIELNLEPVSDVYAEDLKKKRVLLKDKIYIVLRQNSVVA